MNHPADHKRYAAFRLEDFIGDPFFQDGVIRRTETTDAFWQGFLQTYPAQKATVEEARNFLQSLSFKTDHPDEALVQQMLRKHLQQVERLGEKKVIPLHGVRMWWRIAAVFGGLFLCAVLVLLLSRGDEKLTAKTDFGKIERLLLPDSSEVVLNANSSVEYKKNWLSENQREVWLNGEAFFNVKHLNRDTAMVHERDRFLLHTKDLTIEVLGTSFDVRQRRQKTEVVLQTGKIHITFSDGFHQSITMKPGDVVTYDAAKKEVTQTTTTPENYVSWKEKKLLLLNPSVNEIIHYLEDNFGRRIELLSPQLGEVKIEGPILLSNLDDALFVLSTVLKADITEKDTTYFIRSRN